MAKLNALLRSLVKPFNRVDGGNSETVEGVSGPQFGEIELKLDDSELVGIANEFERVAASGNTKELDEARESNKNLWLGNQTEGQSVIERSGVDQPTVDNIIFESIETLLPMATRRNPEPMVVADNTVEGRKLASNVQKKLAVLFDDLSVRLLVKKCVRDWMLYRLGVLKVGWDAEAEEVTAAVIRPHRLILDPSATVDVHGVYGGAFLGERRSATAKQLILRFPKKKAEIEALANGKMGTKLNYTEWWCREYVFWKLNDLILGKARNPHWDYGGRESYTDEFGETRERESRGKNHFATPQVPYVFLSVFNLGLHPWDDTSLIEQVKPLQALINKRLQQIEVNADVVNGGLAISGEKTGLSREEAAISARDYQRGAPFYMPSGDPSTGIVRTIGAPLPPMHYEQLQDVRNEARNLFGTRGSTPQGTVNENTVRGKIIVRSQDSDRVGGLISDHIEQVCDRLANWFVQLIEVYYTTEHSASVIGPDAAVEEISLSRDDFDRQLVVSIKEGSLLPKDELTEANQAIELFNAGAIDPLTLYERLKFPNPEETLKRLILYKADPFSLAGMPPPQAAVDPMAPAVDQQAADLQGQEPMSQIDQSLPA